ncbi:MAG: hypothetical protein IJR55_02020 [Clostridia bacterium]|nr:hypothetical protein [Clostridia bacterium]
MEKQNAKAKKRSALSWIVEFAGNKRSLYAISVVLAILSVVAGFMPSWKER